MFAHLISMISFYVCRIIIFYLYTNSCYTDADIVVGDLQNVG